MPVARALLRWLAPPLRARRYEAREEGVEEADGVAGAAPEPDAGAGGRSLLPPQASPTPFPRHPPDDGGEEEEDKDAMVAWVKHHKALPTLGTVLPPY